MPGDLEQPILIRRFRGVDVSQDPGFIGSDLLVSSDSFTPSPVFVLAKRQGQTLLRQISADLVTFLTASPLLVRTYDDSGNRYLVAVVRSTAGGALDTIVISVNDAAFATPASPTFPTVATVYGAAQLGQIVYLGNGVDPLKAVNLSTTPTITDDPFGITASGSSGAGAAGTPGADPTTPADVNSDIRDGTYSYAWLAYDTATKKWTRRYDARTFLDRAGADHSLTFTAPAAALGATELYHLFVAKLNQPIELATDQSPSGVVAGTGAGAPVGATVVLRSITGSGTPIPIGVASRRGNLLLAHRNRLWVSGDLTPAGAPSNASRVYASSLILPGAEQAIFDMQPFFPLNATLNVGRQDGDRVTALARASMTVTTQSPDAPLLIFKNTALWAFFGDILDDPAAELLQLSAEIGCPAPFSVVETPVGTIFQGLESIYLVRPDQLIPVDIGYPLAPVMRQIPVARRAFSCGLYHRGFYKLTITPSGGTSNTQQWWPDLRRGLGSTPACGGPHTTTPVSAFAHGQQDTVEVDRAYQLQSKGTIAAIDQTNVFSDLVDDVLGTKTTPIVLKLTTSRLDAGAPFDRKRLTRTRAIVRAGGQTMVGVSAMLDSGVAVGAPPFAIPTTVGAWDGTWDGAWGSTTFAEVDSPLTDDAFRSDYRTAEITLTHSEAVNLELHDLEVRYLPVDRRVAARPLGT